MRICYLLFLALICTVISELPNKTAPEHKGIDSAFTSLVADYDALAQKRSIKFTKAVTIGFSKLGMATQDGGHIVGLCTYSKNFREIDIDPDYWRASSPTQHRTLLFHEMTHCLCERGHDYEGGSSYPEPKIKRIIDRIPFFNTPFYKSKAGYYFDGCPLSFMYPYVVSDDCVESHERDYLYEMFNRCKPY